MSRIEQLQAELALLNAEAVFVALKESGEVSDEDRQDLRALRQAYRESVRQPVENGAAPAAINAGVE